MLKTKINMLSTVYKFSIQPAKSPVSDHPNCGHLQEVVAYEFELQEFVYEEKSAEHIYFSERMHFRLKVLLIL